MELDPNDYDVVKLLTKIKNANGAYPAKLLTPRRQSYLRRVAEIGLGFGVATGLKPTVKNGGNSRSFTSTASGLIEAALLLAIVTEAGAAAYIYRDQIAELINSYSSQPEVVEVTEVPETIVSTNLPELVITELPEATPTPETTGTPSPSGTVVASAAANSDQNNLDNLDDQNNQGSQSNSTPDPNGNNGNHFGQTPKPARTVDPGNNDNNNDNTNRNHNGNGK